MMSDGSLERGSELSKWQDVNVLITDEAALKFIQTGADISFSRG